MRAHTNKGREAETDWNGAWNEVDEEGGVTGEWVGDSADI